MKFNSQTVVVLIAFLFVGTVPSLVGSQTQEFNRSDFDYVGSFALPGMFDWGARGADFRRREDGDTTKGLPGSLIITTHDYRANVAEVAIPTPVVSTVLGDLPVAKVLTPEFDVEGGRISELYALDGSDPHSALLGGVEYIEETGDLVFSAYLWYNLGGVNYRNVGTNRFGGNADTVEAWWHVGPFRNSDFHSSRTGDYLFQVPSEWADRNLGGKSLITGFHRSAGAFGSSQGPAFFAFAPPAEGSEPTSDLEALDLMWFPEEHKCLAFGPEGFQFQDPDACSYPDYRPCDTWQSGVWIERGEKSAMLLAGMKSIGETTYSGGYYCGEYLPYFTLFDPAQLIEAAQGKRKPWKVLPYAAFRPEGIWDATGSYAQGLGGAAFDIENGFLYVVQKHEAGAKSVVHVWELAP